MKINKIKVTKWKYWIDCPKCEKEIRGTSEIMVEHNYKVHKEFCKGIKNE